MGNMSVKKNRKRRGNVSSGHGRVGKHRKHPGGRGSSAGQHHHRISFSACERRYFGKFGLKSYNMKLSNRGYGKVNLEKLTHSKREKLTRNKNKINAKVLGKGSGENFSNSLLLAKATSAKTNEKIRNAGGKVVLLS